ncbi:uncharacterized protein METZ01_LOCUS512137, partial [marine metagenome]
MKSYGYHKLAIVPNQLRTSRILAIIMACSVASAPAWTDSESDKTTSHIIAA